MTTFPISLADFWGSLRITSVRMSLPEVAQMTRTAGGETVVASLGRRLWRASVQLAPSTFADSQGVQARMRVIRRADASFLVSPLIGRVPALDPLGTVASAAVTVATVSADRVAVALAGLPAGYTMSAGDFLSISVNGIPHLHQIVIGGSADGAGLTPELEVVPPVRVSVTTGMAITLVDPTMKAVCDPASVEEGQLQRAQLTGVSLSLIQTLK